MRRLLFVVLFIKAVNGYSQNDLLVLKQKNQIIQTWMKGSFISFQFSSKQWLQGSIKAIQHDSIILEQMIIEQVPNRFGFPTIDTARMGLLKLHINEIYAIPKRNMGSGLFSNGVLFQLGSGAFIFLNIFNSLIYKEAVFSSQNLTSLGIAAGVFVAGTLLGAAHKTYLVLGHKYTMQTLHTAGGSNK